VPLEDVFLEEGAAADAGERRQRLRSLFEAVKSATSREDLLCYLRQALIVQVARQKR
jgi:hypothetical protein